MGVLLVWRGATIVGTFGFWVFMVAAGFVRFGVSVLVVIGWFEFGC